MRDCTEASDSDCEFVELAFTQADLEKAIQNPRLMAVAAAFVDSQINLGQAFSLGAKDLAPFFPATFDWVALLRFLVALADGIAEGRYTRPPEAAAILDQIQSEYSESKNRPSIATRGVATTNYKDLLDPKIRIARLAMWRPSYNKRDFEAMIKDDFYLALVDAYKKLLITFPELTRRYTGSPQKWPRGLGLHAFLTLTIFVAKQIDAGEIRLPTDLQKRFPGAYLK